MTSVVFVEEPHAAQVANECKLRLFINPSDGKYSFQFEKNSFVLRNKDDTIDFILINEIAHATVRILKHISTPCEPKDSKPKKVDIKMINGTVPPVNPYDGLVKHASYAVTLEEYEMLHIGLIVEILHDDDPGRAYRLICDPQVGNGPP